MKTIKFFFITMLVAFSSVMFGQGGFQMVYVVPDATTNFKTNVPAGSLVYMESTNQFYLLETAVGRTVNMNYILADPTYYTQPSVTELGGYDVEYFVDTATAQNVYGLKTWHSPLVTSAGTNGNNSRIGLGSMANVTTGYGNVAISPKALYYNTTGYSNIAIGDSALRQITAGHNNIGIGRNTLSGAITTGVYNIAIGSQAGVSVSGVGSNNILIGATSGDAVTTGTSNVFIGLNAGTETTIANNNVGIGANALKYNVTGATNVAIGYNAGLYETGSGKLIIHNDAGGADTALIYGDFSTPSLQINGATEVNANLTATGTISTNDYISVAGRYLFDSAGIYVADKTELLWRLLATRDTNYTDVVYNMDYLGSLALGAEMDTTVAAKKGKIVFQASDSTFYGCRSTVAVKKWYSLH